jgi:hypothetical protein
MCKVESLKLRLRWETSIIVPRSTRLHRQSIFGLPAAILIARHVGAIFRLLLPVGTMSGKDNSRDNLELFDFRLSER